MAYIILHKNYYSQEDTLCLSKDLIGKYLLTNIDGVTTGGRILETEGYLGVEDRACHAYGGRRTARTETMYASGGVAYVYLCYGLHALLNIVTHKEGVPHAILIRAIQPEIGLQTIQMRRGDKIPPHRLTSGPGMVTQALGITLEHNGTSLSGDQIWIEDRGVTPQKIIATPRVGVDYAGEDAHLPYRFTLA